MNTQEKTSTSFIPLANTQAGLSLTYDNWQKAGIKTLALNLDSLLIKPGLSFLQNLSSLKTYYSWFGELILNASSLKALPMEEGYELRSIYDGSRVRISLLELFSLIKSLKPQRLILPLASSLQYAQFWQDLPRDMMVYYHQTERYNLPQDGLNFYAKTSETLQAKKVTYLIDDGGAFNLADVPLTQPLYFESDAPAYDASQGLVYLQGKKANILQPSFKQDFNILEPSCLCETCKQGFTYAYLQHLFQHTPLLAQRYLIQHNVFCARAIFSFLS